uniref:Uncharacterized protein n=1 Tax=Geospiza parvula TaxID=87175 RepID=A0A8C3Q950_GEOPR
MCPLCPPASVLPGSRPHWARPITCPHHQLQDPRPHSITGSIPFPAPEPPGSIATPAPEPPNSIPSPSPCPFSHLHSIPSPHHPPSPPLPSLGAHHPPSPPHIWSGPRGGCSGRTHPPNQQPPSPAAGEAAPPPVTSWSQRGQLFWRIRSRLTHPPHQEAANQQDQELHVGPGMWGADPNLRREGWGEPSRPAAAPALGRARPCAPACVCVCLVAGFDPIQDSRQAPLGSGNKSLTGIDDCSSNPCANSGTCVDGNQSYTCLCPPGWSGPSCQSPIYSYWVTLSNTSFSRQPRCAEGRSGSRRCSCDTGFQLQPGGVCQDVDECQLYQSSPQTQICLHDCLNLPGSYRCLCPPGYLLHADRNACEDVNECTRKQHNCSQGDLCINTFGGYRCVRPKCPPPRHNTSYVKTSASQCERNPCPMDSRACQLAASSISFHYLPLQANRTVPRVLFRMSTTRSLGDSLRFAIAGGHGRGVFAVRRSDRHTGELLLTSPVAGPATLEVEVEMSEFSHKVLLGKHIFKVTAFVSPYVF